MKNTLQNLGVSESLQAAYMDRLLIGKGTAEDWEIVDAVHAEIIENARQHKGDAHALKVQAALESMELYQSHPAGKMDGITTITTSNHINALCKARSKNTLCVCSHCYASNIMFWAAIHYLRNSELLALQSMRHTRIYSDVCRFESHGDLINTYHAINYLNIAYNNPGVTFALWTKNLHFINDAVDRVGKPENIIIVYSESGLNGLNLSGPLSGEYFRNVDKIFTVYDKEHAAAVGINCGARSCRGCLRCYTKNAGVEYIRELLK